MILRIKSARYLAGGTFLGALVNLIAVPLVVGLYGYEGFGSYAQVYFMATLLGCLSSLRIEWQLPDMNPGSTEYRRTILICLVFGTATSVALGLMLQMLMFPEAESSGLHLALCTLGVQQMMMSQVFHAALISKQNLAGIGVCRLVVPSITAIAQILVFTLLPSPSGLLAGWVLGLAAGNSVGLALLLHGNGMATVGVGKQAWLREFFCLASKSKSSLAANCMGLALMPLQLQLIGTLYGLGAVGIFAAAWRLLVAPCQMLGGIIGQQMWSEVAYSRRHSSLPDASVYRKKLAAVLLVVVACLSAVVFSSDVLLTYAEKHADLGEILDVIVPFSAICISAFIMATSHFLALGKQHWKAALDLLLICCVVGGYFVGFDGFPAWLTFMSATYGLFGMIFLALHFYAYTAASCK